MGALYHFIARGMDLVILFPLGAGLLLGALLAIPIYTIKIRARSFVILCAILASVLLLGTRMFCDSLLERETLIGYVTGSLSLAKTARAGGKAKVHMDEQVEARLRRHMSPFGYFRTYLKNAARSGIVIGDVGKSSKASDLVLRGPWFWASQILNLALIAAMAIAATLNYAGAPFCPDCRKWLGQMREVTKVHPDQSAQLVEKLKLKDWDGAAGIVGKGVDDKQQSVVSLASCPSCGQTQLKVKTTRGTTSKTVLEMPISAADATRLREARAQRL